jgi:hypothetical protein
MKNGHRVFYGISLLSFVTTLGSCVGCLVKLGTQEARPGTEETMATDRWFFAVLIAFLLTIVTFALGVIGTTFANREKYAKEMRAIKKKSQNYGKARRK